LFKENLHEVCSFTLELETQNLTLSIGDGFLHSFRSGILFEGSGMN